MSEEERAALHRDNQVVCRANLVLNQKRLAGSKTSRHTLSEAWRPLVLARIERDYPADDYCELSVLTPTNRDCIC